MKSTIATSAKGLKNHMVVRGTALMMALGFEAVGSYPRNLARFLWSCK